MTIADRPGVAIGIGERYRDVVSDRWPAIVAPQHDELLSSWLRRLAYANGVAPRAFARVLDLGPGMRAASVDLRLPADVARLLHAHTGLSLRKLSAMPMTSSPLKPLLLPLRSDGRRGSSTWLQFCSRCLADDAQPYFRRRWRFATQVSCLIHGCGLRDRCPSCANRIAAFDQDELVPQHFCYICGFDLRRASNVAVRAPARRLDRCINDICRLEAITGSLTTSSLVQRLLDMPATAGVYPTLNLVGLSTAARIRCMERLAEQPVNWLTTEDDFVVAHRRRLILAAGGHAPLIAYIVTKLERRAQRHLPTSRPPQAAELPAVLGAYLRIREADHPPTRRNRGPVGDR